MQPTFRRVVMVVLFAIILGGTVLSAAIIVSTSDAGAVAATTPPWEPDPNSVGGLIFYNSSGQAVTSGSVNDSPVAAYVQGTATVRAGDTKATLFGYLPVAGEPPGEWSGEQLGSSTVYPNASAPAPLNSSALPVETGASGDETIAQLEADFPNNDTSSDGYADMYVLRLKTSAQGQPGNVTYDSADIEVNSGAGTWSVVYSQTTTTTTTTTTTSGPRATETSLGVSPASSAYFGTDVKLKAGVSPSTAAGTLQLLDGSKVLKTLAVSSGTAGFVTSKLSDGTHKLSARFVPTNSALFAASSSSVHKLKVSAHPTTTSLKASKSLIDKGQTLKLTARVSPSAAGSVKFYDGAKKLATVKLEKGVAHCSTSALSPGKHSLKAVFSPTTTAADASSSSKTVKVTVEK